MRIIFSLAFFLFALFVIICPSYAHAQSSRIYVANANENTVSVVDGDTNNVLTTIPVTASPRAMVVTPDGSKVYVTHTDSNFVTVINALTDTVMTTITVGTRPGEGNITIDSSGTHVYIPNASSNTISVIDTQTNSVAATIPVGGGPASTVVSPDGSKVYVTNQNDNSISVINTQNNTVITTIPNVGEGPGSIAISPDGSKIYTANAHDSTLSIIDTSTDSIITKVQMSLGDAGVVVSPDGNRVYVSNNNCCAGGLGTVSVIDASSNTLLTTIPVGPVPDLLSISFDGTRVYVPNNGGPLNPPSSNTMSVIDTASNTVVGTVTVGNNPYATAVGRVPNQNQAPIVGTVTVSQNPVQINTSVTATATFIDPDAGQIHTATANWGDGINTATSCSLTEPNGSTPGSVNCQFSGYSVANVYPVTISVSDGIAQPVTSPVSYASVFNPTQSSIFSAGEKFSNPSSANPSTSGTVKFGLTYKYKGGTANSNRAFSMDFKNAGLHFSASTVTSLVISNGMATLQGTGTLTGQSGTFNFLVTGFNNGGIRIQITDSSNNVVYDTQPGDPITATPTTTTGHVLVQ